MRNRNSLVCGPLDREADVVSPVSSAAGSPIIDTDDLVERVRTDFGIVLRSTVQIHGGQDSDAVLLKATTDTGSEVAVKASRHSRTGSLLTQAALARRISTGVPAPLVGRAGLPYSSTGSARLSMTPWIAGRGAYSTGLDADQWRAFGELLAEVHAARDLPKHSAELPIEDYRTPAADHARALDARIGASPDRLPDPMSAALISAWRAARSSIVTILEHVDELGDQLRADPAPLVICHGDAHLGNVQIDVDGALWLLDWDEAMLAPRERDLMFVIVGVLAQPVTEEQQRWFFQGYGSAGISEARLAYYRCSWAVEDIADFAARVLDEGRDELAGRAKARAQALEFFRGVVSTSGIAALAVRSLQHIGRTIGGHEHH